MLSLEAVGSPTASSSDSSSPSMSTSVQFSEDTVQMVGTDQWQECAAPDTSDVSMESFLETVPLGSHDNSALALSQSHQFAECGAQFSRLATIRYRSSDIPQSRFGPERVCQAIQGFDRYSLSPDCLSSSPVVTGRITVEISDFLPIYFRILIKGTSTSYALLMIILTSRQTSYNEKTGLSWVQNMLRWYIFPKLGSSCLKALKLRWRRPTRCLRIRKT